MKTTNQLRKFVLIAIMAIGSFQSNSQTPPPVRPTPCDLTVTKFEITGPDAQGVITLNYTIRNIGGTTAYNINTVSVGAYWKPANETVRLGYKYLSTTTGAKLSSGGVISASFTSAGYQPKTEGPFDITLIVDDRSKLVEKDETNNSKIVSLNAFR